MKIDDREFQQRVKQYVDQMENKTKRSVLDVAKEIMRLSQREVPIGETRELQNSGSVSPDAPSFDITVGYNKVYAAFQHEGGDEKRVIKKWGNGRKGKYLEDPIKNNLSFFRRILSGGLR